jgi:hypothetical protein
MLSPRAIIILAFTFGLLFVAVQLVAVATILSPLKGY